jgi:hypothetical protein
MRTSKGLWSNKNKWIIMLVLIIVIIIIIVLVFTTRSRKEGFGQDPSSVAQLTQVTTPQAEKAGPTLDQLTIESPRKNIYGNITDFPSFFHVAEKWPGCLPRPLYQGTCGSCWGFASVTALSSRFFIESCGTGGCNNYPQINFGSLNNVNYNINEVYKFRQLYLTDAIEKLDTSKDGSVSEKEWNDIIAEYYDIFNDQGSPYLERHYIAQILVYFLNFQSLGSLDLTNKAMVLERAAEAFNIWTSLIDMSQSLKGLEASTAPVGSEGPKVPERAIVIKQLEDLWLNEPITLSAEKIISCCNNCMKLDYQDEANGPTGPEDYNKDIICLGSTLDEAWTMLRESGTPTVTCIGYNLDAWKKGSYSPSCKEVQGPTYSFCSGYVIDKSNFNIGTKDGQKTVNWFADITEKINELESSPVSPLTIPSNKNNLPWIDLQLFRFRAKNVYKVNPNIYAIQREILERGPVTAAFTLYPDFQNSFGITGGQLYPGPEVNPLGSQKNSLIYSWNGVGKPIGGHSIVIVGWGLYRYQGATKVYEVPYWICLNSWGAKWGTSGFPSYNDRTKEPINMKSGGYFWILRGYNMCSIENNVIVGQPNISNISYPGIPDKYGWGLPGPNQNDVTYIKQRTEPVDLGDRNFLEFKMPNDGGGSYNERKIKKDETLWYVDSMDPPSPFVLFWDDSRPIYCAGPLVKQISELSIDTVITVSEETSQVLLNVQKIQNNPIIIIGDEQLQLIGPVPGPVDPQGPAGPKGFKVYRGINNSYVSKHSVGSIVKIMPYKGLNTTELSKIVPLCTGTKSFVE